MFHILDHHSTKRKVYEFNRLSWYRLFQHGILRCLCKLGIPIVCQKSEIQKIFSTKTSSSEPLKSELVHWISTQSCAWIQLRYSYFQLLLSRKMSSGQNTMRTPTLQPVPESLPADHVSNSNKKKVGSILMMKTLIN